MWGRVERRGVGHQHGQQRHDVLRQPRHHRGEDERRRSMAPPSEWCRQEQSPSQRTKEGAAGGGDEAKHERRAHRVFSCGCFVCVCIAGANGLDRRRGWNRARVRRTWRAAWYLVIII